MSLMAFLFTVFFRSLFLRYLGGLRFFTVSIYFPFRVSIFLTHCLCTLFKSRQLNTWASHLGWSLVLDLASKHNFALLGFKRRLACIFLGYLTCCFAEAPKLERPVAVRLASVRISAVLRSQIQITEVARLSRLLALNHIFFTRAVISMSLWSHFVFL